MKSFSHCSQYYPYAGKVDPCSGVVHNLTIRSETEFGKPITTIVVCDGHMQSFMDLCERPKYETSIIGNEVVGEIEQASIEGKPPAKER